MHKKLLFLTLLVLQVYAAKAQFMQGIGIMGGITVPRQKWWVTTSEGDNKERHKYIWVRFNGELFAEFINHDYINWRTEFQYSMKGTKHKPTGEKNKVSYIAWNNFLKVKVETYRGYPYFLIGPRVEYLLSQATPSIPNGFSQLHFSWSVGAGFEFITYGQLKPLIEFHYNPDINYAEKADLLDVKNRALELRVGLKYVFEGTKSCPAVYK